MAGCAALLGLTGSSDLKMAKESTEGDVADAGGGLVGVVVVVTCEGEVGSVAMEMKMSRNCRSPNPSQS